MTPAPGSKQDKDDFSKFIYYVQRTFIILSHECYFPRTCIRLCLARLNVPCMCAYVIVFVCVYVFLRQCECVSIACACACVPQCVWVCLYLYLHVCLDGFLNWCCVFDLGMYKTHVVIALFQLRLVPIHDCSTEVVTGYRLGMDGEMRRIVDDFARIVKNTDHSKTLWLQERMQSAVLVQNARVAMNGAVQVQ